MGMEMRVSLPGYDCLTDTNLDHYALNSNEDNVLIKEYTRGTATISAGGTLQVPHNLGYIPQYYVYMNYAVNQASGRSLIPAYQNNAVSVPPQVATVDTTNLS